MIYRQPLARPGSVLRHPADLDADDDSQAKGAPSGYGR